LKTIITMSSEEQSEACKEPMLLDSTLSLGLWKLIMTPIRDQNTLKQKNSNLTCIRSHSLKSRPVHCRGRWLSFNFDSKTSHPNLPGCWQSYEMGLYSWMDDSLVIMDFYLRVDHVLDDHRRGTPRWHLWENVYRKKNFVIVFTTYRVYHDLEDLQMGWTWSCHQDFRKRLLWQRSSPATVHADGRILR